jgi:hypothetical protein
MRAMRCTRDAPHLAQLLVVAAALQKSASTAWKKWLVAPLDGGFQQGHFLREARPARSPRARRA